MLDSLQGKIELFGKGKGGNAIGSGDGDVRGGGEEATGEWWGGDRSMEMKTNRAVGVLCVNRSVEG